MEVIHKSDGEIKTSGDNNLYEILKKLPTPKKEFELTKSQKKWWYWFGKEFIKTNQFSILDLIHLKNAAIQMDASIKIQRMINKLNDADDNGVAGYVQVFKNNTNNITGYVTMLEKINRQLDNVSAHFGLSIKDRQKLKSIESNESQLSLMDIIGFIDRKAQ